MKPAWLPSTISLDGRWEETLTRLYRIFEQDFILTKCFFEHREIWWNNVKLDGKYDEGFWHIISIKDQATLERIPDFERAKRLPWCAPLISNSHDPATKCWDYEEADGKVRTYIWLEQWDYLVILEKRTKRIGEIAFLITAYFVSGSASRKKLLKKYDERIA